MARRRARRGHSASGEAGAGRARLTAASRGATPTARAVTCALPGPASLPATRRARRLPTASGPCDPGKRSHTCAQHLPPALAEGARREKGPRAAKFAPKNEVGRCFPPGGQEWPRSSLGVRLRTVQAEGSQGRAPHLPARAVEPESGPGKPVGLPRARGRNHGSWGCGVAAGKGQNQLPHRFSLGSEVSGRLQPGEERPPASFAEPLDSRFFGGRGGGRAAAPGTERTPSS